MVVKIQGGLGNQMFQYAYGRNLELSGKKVIFDVSFFYGNKFKEDTPRNFGLSKFNIQTQGIFSTKKHRVTDFFVKIKRFLGSKVDVYFQSEKYFTSIQDVIKKEFSLKSDFSVSGKKILQDIENNNSISLHVRRGDYITNQNAHKHHGVCGLDYYQVALKLIKEKVSEPIFFVFSDDIKWAKENFVGANYVFVSALGIDDVEEIMLMSKCKYNIIANSTFSWWGAWLNQNPDKMVIAPKRWLLAADIDTSDLLPESWIKL